jgi:hypothetical protein
VAVATKNVGAIDCSAVTPKSTRNSERGEVPRVDLTLPGRLRADEVKAILRVRQSRFYKGIRTGVYPKPDFYEGRTPFWKNSTLLKFLEGEKS